MSRKDLFEEEFEKEHAVRVGREKACLVSVRLKEHRKWESEDSLEELAFLTRSAGAEVLHRMTVVRARPSPAYYIGKGKAEELKGIVDEQGIGLVIFDNDLTPGQERKLREFLEVKVLDRTELILDIFAQRALSNEGKLQIELAQLNYMLPRLTRLWTHLSRQEGGIGTRGPGEKQLEIDRRRVRDKIVGLKKQLEKIKNERNIQRQHRIRKGFPLISIVGYSNAGKSTLFNALSKSGATVKDQLFTTLNPMARKISLPNNQQVIISDTVGFLNKLPHHLIEAFKATLEEVVVADLLIHVIDVTSPQMAQKYAAVMEVLEQLGAVDKPILNVLNKTDLVEEPAVIDRAKRDLSAPVAISAVTGDGFQELSKEIIRNIGREREFCRFFIPHSRAGAVSGIFQSGSVWEKAYKPEGLYISAEVPVEVKGMLKEFLIDSEAEGSG
jgi:GTPase